METIIIPLSSISANTMTFLKEANRLAKEEKSFCFTFSNSLFKHQLHLMTCNGIQDCFIRVNSHFDKNMVSMINMVISTKKVSFKLEKNDLLITF